MNVIWMLLSQIFTVTCTTATSSPQIYSLSLHDALPIFQYINYQISNLIAVNGANGAIIALGYICVIIIITIFLKNVFLYLSYYRSEEHTSELQSRENLVCRLLLEIKKTVILRFQGKT